LNQDTLGNACSMYGHRRGEHRVLLRKPEGKGPTQHVWDNITIDHQEVRWGNGLDSSPSGKGQLAGTCKMR